MEPVAETPTAPVDYATLSALYGTLLALTAATAGRRETIAPGEIVPLSAASFALAKLVVHEKVETWVRAPFVEETANGRRPKGRRMRFAVGELLSCTRCMGAWSALALVALRLAAPQAGRAVTAVLAASAGNDFLQTTFSYAGARANVQKRVAEETVAATAR